MCSTTRASQRCGSHTPRGGEQLERLGGGVGWRVADAYQDGEALWRRVCERGLEGVVAKRLSGSYQPGRRGWVKVKNTEYWRYPLEREAVRRGRERDGLRSAVDRRSPMRGLVRQDPPQAPDRSAWPNQGMGRGVAVAPLPGAVPSPKALYRPASRP